MVKHKQDYCDFFGYSVGDYVQCELTGLRADDIHHIDCRGMGGTTNERIHSIENLMALIRVAHDFFGDKKQWMEFLKKAHLSFLETQIPWAILHPESREIYLLYAKNYRVPETDEGHSFG